MRKIEISDVIVFCDISVLSICLLKDVVKISDIIGIESSRKGRIRLDIFVDLVGIKMKCLQESQFFFYFFIFALIILAESKQI